jgi:hypothetical protein
VKLCVPLVWTLAVACERLTETEVGGLPPPDETLVPAHPEISRRALKKTDIRTRTGLVAVHSAEIGMAGASLSIPPRDDRIE